MIKFSEKNDQMGNHIIAVVEKSQAEHRVHANQKMPCASTFNVYQHLSVNDDPCAHMIRDGSFKMKDRRRQMASTLVRSLSSQIGAVVYANFRPVPQKWDHPKALPK